jgi:hypothetical protein
MTIDDMLEAMVDHTICDFVRLVFQDLSTIDNNFKNYKMKLV